MLDGKHQTSRWDSSKPFRAIRNWTRKHRLPRNCPCKCKSLECPSECEGTSCNCCYNCFCWTEEREEKNPNFSCFAIKKSPSISEDTPLLRWQTPGKLPSSHWWQQTDNKQRDPMQQSSGHSWDLCCKDMRAAAFFPFFPSGASFLCWKHSSRSWTGSSTSLPPSPNHLPVYLLSTLDRDEIFHHIHKLNRHMKGNHDDSILAFSTCRQILFAPFSLPSAPPFITLPQFTWLHRQTARKTKQ